MFDWDDLRIFLAVARAQRGAPARSASTPPLSGGG
jgi:hypothetical protein